MSKADTYRNTTEAHNYMHYDIYKVIQYIYRPFNLHIIHILKIGGPQTVTEVMIKIRSCQSQTAAYLSALENTGLLSKMRQGKNVYYQLTPKCEAFADHIAATFNILNDVVVTTDHTLIHNNE